MSAVRTTYYADFWKAINEDKMDKAEKYAKILIELESNWSRIKTSGVNRKMTDEEIDKASNLYEEIEKNK